jgi:hypothetical protein
MAWHQGLAGGGYLNVVTVQLSRVKGTQNGGKIKNLNDTNYFPCLTNFKLFSQIEGKSIIVIFLKFVISFKQPM